MSLNVTQNEIDLFTADLWKDIRKLQHYNTNGDLTIRRYSDTVISIEDELPFLEFLKKQNPSWRIPQVISHTPEYIEFEYLNGIRLFNFIIELRILYLIEKSEKALNLMERIKAILTNQLLDFQKITLPWTKNISVQYPFVEKCFTPIELIANVVGLSFNKEEVRNDISAIAEIVSKNCDALFRDATPKNAILHIPELYYDKFKYDDAARRIVIRSLVNSDFFTDELLKDKIYQFDFTGCVYLCPKIDDLIAINLHESMMWAKSSQKFFDENCNDKVFLATMFVRFIRFGGRKLAYRLLHKDGHIKRFRFDNEKYYFEKLQDVVSRLQKLNLVKGNELIRIMKRFEDATVVIPTVDYFDPDGTKSESVYIDVYPH